MEYDDFANLGGTSSTHSFLLLLFSFLFAAELVELKALAVADMASTKTSKRVGDSVPAANSNTIVKR
jgi:hypothetical protein